MGDEHPHHHEPHEEGPERGRPADPAGEHLAAALRTSFRLLGAIMVLAVAAFFAMGFEFVQPDEVAIRTVFGRVVGTTEKGLAYNWPSPIGRIETVKASERTIRVNDLWMHETPEEMTQDLRRRRVPPGGLRPGWDGALLTGDRNLLHLRLTCTYAVSRQWDARKGTDPVLLFKRNVSDPNEVMRSALCDAAVRAAAVRTADGLLRTEQARFQIDVHRLTQRLLDDLETGLVVRSVKVVQPTWPLRTLADYDAAQRAVSEAEAARSRAMKEAVSTLNAVAGPVASRKLVGDPADVAGLGRPAGPAGQADDYDLIGQYSRALRKGDQPLAERLLARIDDVLVSRTSGGETSRAIDRAWSYQSATVEAVKRRVKRFKELLPEYEKAPQFMIQRLWDETREAILSSPTVEKHYVGPDGKVIVRLSRDPDVVRKRRAEMLKKARQGAEDKPAGP